MSTVKNGDTVKVHYTGTLDSGEVFDSSREREPIAFTLGAGMMIPGFEKGVMGMTVGEKKTIKIPCAEAYGAHSQENMIKVPKSQVPPGMEPKAGMMVELRSPQGQAIPVRIAEVTEESVTLDGNHPLAGQDLNFDLELVSLEPAA
ncbi:peptidylprolyl isomerase [Oscillatoria amoena NRMC-F 0135]|nr:peptidylprolyl isomerase [Oscillatoria amoena NRMC-F 0135]